MEIGQSYLPRILFYSRKPLFYYFYWSIIAFVCVFAVYFTPAGHRF